MPLSPIAGTGSPGEQDLPRAFWPGSSQASASRSGRSARRPARRRSASVSYADQRRHEAVSPPRSSRPNGFVGLANQLTRATRYGRARRVEPTNRYPASGGERPLRRSGTPASAQCMLCAPTLTRVPPSARLTSRTAVGTAQDDERGWMRGSSIRREGRQHLGRGEALGRGLVHLPAGCRPRSWFLVHRPPAGISRRRRRTTS